MSTSDLEKTLKEWRSSAPPDEYWEMFPRRVLARLKAAPRLELARRSWLPRLAWAAGCVAVCLAFLFIILQWRGGKEMLAKSDLLQNQKVVRELLTLFPNRVRAIIQDEHGMRLVLSEQPDVPSSTPLWIKICNKQRCQSAVTFSGQELPLAGDNIEVLESAQGDVTLVGHRFLWRSGDSGQTGPELRIQARALRQVL